MATARDAEAGYRIYLDLDGLISRPELNAELVGRDFAPISDRVYQHYRKLTRHGYTTYMPINRFDVKTLRDPIWHPAMDRTELSPVEETAQIVFEAPNEKFVAIPANILEVGHWGFVANLRHVDMQPLLSVGFEVSTLAYLVLGAGDAVEPVRLLSQNISASRSFIRARFEFDAVGASERFAGKELPNAQVRFLFYGWRERPLGELARLLYWLQETVDAADWLTRVYGGHDTTAPRVLRVTDGSVVVDLATDRDVQAAIFATLTVIRLRRRSIFDTINGIAELKVNWTKMRESTRPERLEQERRLFESQVKKAELETHQQELDLERSELEVDERRRQLDAARRPELPVDMLLDHLDPKGLADFDGRTAEAIRQAARNALEAGARLIQVSGGLELTGQRPGGEPPLSPVRVEPPKPDLEALRQASEEIGT